MEKDAYYWAELCSNTFRAGDYEKTIEQINIFSDLRKNVVIELCPEAETQIYFINAECLVNINKNNFEKAMDCMICAEQSLNLVNDIDSKFLLVLDYYLTSSKIYYDVNLINDAERYAMETYMICKENEYRQEHFILAINNLALFKYDMGEIDESWKYVNEGLDCIVEENMIDSPVAEYIYQRCSMLTMNDSKEDSLNILSKAQELARQTISMYEMNNELVSRISFLQLIDIEKKMKRLFSLGTIIVCDYPVMIREMMNAKELKELLFSLLRQEHDLLNKYVNIMNYSILLRMTTGLQKIMSQILSYSHAGIIKCTNEEVFEVVVNCKSIFTDVLRNKNRKMRKEQICEYRWLSFQQICSLLPEHTVYIDYVDYPGMINKEQYLGELQIDYFALLFREGQPIVERFKPINLLFARIEYMKLIAYTRTTKTDDVKKYAETFIGKEKDANWNLYMLILKPIIERLDKSITKLIISADIDINVYPFALFIDDSKTILERYRIIYVNSIRNYKAGMKYSISDFSKPLVIGNPKFSLDDSLFDDNRRDEGLLPLPLSKVEVRQVADILNTKALVGKNASKEVLFDTEFDLIHIATHGNETVLDDEEDNHVYSLKSSCLYFAGANDWLITGQEKENYGTGIVTGEELCEIQGRNLKLVVLSACFSGSGELNYNQGLLGLRTAFLSLGSHALILSLWEVDDFASAVLMDYFYHSINGKAISDALREAQLYLKEVSIGELAFAGWFEEERVRKIGLVANTIREIAKLPKEMKLFHSYRYWAGYICLEQE